jgi:hypothetical protein
MPHYSTGWSVHRDGDTRRTAIHFERCPRWVEAVRGTAFGICWLTRNRACRWLCHPAIDLVERHSESFDVFASPEDVAAWAEWRGLGRPFWVDDEGRQIPYGDDYVRVP